MRASTRGLGSQELRAPAGRPPAGRIRAASQPCNFCTTTTLCGRSNSCRKQPGGAASRSRSPTATGRAPRLPEVTSNDARSVCIWSAPPLWRLPCISDSLEAGAGVASGAPKMSCSYSIARRVHRTGDRWLAARRLTKRPAKFARGAAGGLCARRGARASSMASLEAAPVPQTGRIRPPPLPPPACQPAANCCPSLPTHLQRGATFESGGLALLSIARA